MIISGNIIAHRGGSKNGWLIWKDKEGNTLEIQTVGINSYQMNAINRIILVGNGFDLAHGLATR